jgi:hypothetical protein
MRHVRFLLSVLLALSLAAAPVWAGVPNLHGAAPDMSMAAPDECHCCDQTRDQTADACPLKCCGLAAILVEGQGWAAPCPKADIDGLEAGLSPFSMRPDPPPPRS